MNVEIYPRKIFAILLYVILFLLLANVAGIVSRFYFEYTPFKWLIMLFDFNAEKNIPTFYSAFSLITASILLAFIASVHRKLGSSYIPWAGLAVIFLYLSIDEIASLHERLGGVVHEAFNTSGLLFYAWVIPYGAALIVFILVYLKFLMRLPGRIAALFLASGATYVAGSIGFELLAGRQHDLHGIDNLTYAFFYTCEEALEMLGIAVFIYALLSYVASQFKGLTIAINE